MHPRMVALVGVLCASAGWMVSRAVAPDAPAASAIPSSPRPLGQGAATALNTAPVAAPSSTQLRARLQERPSSPAAVRNPFVFAPRRPAPVRANDRREVAALPVGGLSPDPLPTSAGSRIRLSGIASNQRDGVQVFTAILNDNGTMVFAAVGDRLSGGYIVSRIDDTTVALTSPTGARTTLRLP